MAEPDDVLMATRLAVAKIEGMLTVVISNNDNRIKSLEESRIAHEIRLNDKAKTIARHDERIEDLEGDIAEAKNDTRAKEAKSLAFGSLALGAVVAIIAIFNFISGLPTTG